MDCLTDLGLRSSSESEGVLPDDLWIPSYESMIHVGWIDFSGVGMRSITGQTWFRHRNPGFALSFWGDDILEAARKTLQLHKPRFLLLNLLLPSPHRMMLPFGGRECVALLI